MALVRSTTTNQDRTKWSGSQVQAALSQLPSELIREISNYLPPSARIALKLTNRHLYLKVPIPDNYDLHGLHLCEKNAVRRVINEHKYSQTSRRWCLICKTLQPLRNFRDDTAICCQHDARFQRLGLPRGLDDATRERLLELARRVRKTCWVEVSRRMCMHCHTMQTWDARRCWCRCDSCGLVGVNCLVRLSRRWFTPNRWQRVGIDRRQMGEEFNLGGTSSWLLVRVWGGSDISSVIGNPPHIHQITVPIMSLGEAEKLCHMAT